MCNLVGPQARRWIRQLPPCLPSRSAQLPTHRCRSVNYCAKHYHRKEEEYEYYTYVPRHVRKTAIAGVIRSCPILVLLLRQARWNLVSRSAMNAKISVHTHTLQAMKGLKAGGATPNIPGYLTVTHRDITRYVQCSTTCFKIFHLP